MNAHHFDRIEQVNIVLDIKLRKHLNCKRAIQKKKKRERKKNPRLRAEKESYEGWGEGGGARFLETTITAITRPLHLFIQHFFLQHLYSALFTNKRALMRYLTNRILDLYEEI